MIGETLSQIIKKQLGKNIMTDNTRPKTSFGAEQDSNANLANTDNVSYQTDVNQGNDDLFGDTDIFGINRATASGNKGTTEPAEVTKFITEAYARVSKNLSVPFYIATVQGSNGLSIDAVVVYAYFKGRFVNYTLLIETDRSFPGTTIKPINGVETELFFTTSAWYDEKMINVINGVIAQDATDRGLITGTVNSGDFVSASHAVITRDNELAETDDLAAYFDAAVSGIMGTLRILEGIPTSQITSAKLASKNLQLNARVKINGGATTTNAFKATKASDFNIEVTARAAHQDVTSRHSDKLEVAISSVTGHVDFNYAPPDNDDDYRADYNGQMPFVPGYRAVVVITDISRLSTAENTNDDIGTMIHSLGSLMPIIEQDRWTEIWTRLNGDYSKKPDPGFFGLEFNPGCLAGVPFVPEQIESSVGAIQTEGVPTILQTIRQYVRPTALVAIDVEHGSPFAWIQAMFANAAVTGSNPELIIFNELNKFSGGKWDAIWATAVNKSIMALAPVDGYTGTYSSNGEIRDLNTIDYLSTLELAGNDEAKMIQFAKCFTPGSNSPAEMTVKRNLIKEFAGGTENITGMFTRFFFNTEFINKINELYKACGLVVITDGISDVIADNVRALPFGAYKPVAATSSGVFQQWAANAPQAFNQVNHFAGDGFVYKQ